MTAKGYYDLVREAKSRVKEVTVQETIQILTEHPETVVVDCREPNESALATIAGAVVIPRGVLEQNIERVANREQKVIIYCAGGNRSALAADTLREMRRAGVRRAVGFIAAAQHSYSSCQQYRENVASAREQLRGEGRGDVDVTYVGSWYDHRLFVAANASHVRVALRQLPEAVQREARLVFTAHSIPLPMAERSR